MLAPGRVGEHAVDVEDHGRPRFEHPGAPVPVLFYVVSIHQSFPTQNARNGGDGHDTDGVGVNPPAPEIPVENPAGGHRRQPKHNAESANREAANMNKRVHTRVFQV